MSLGLRLGWKVADLKIERLLAMISYARGGQQRVHGSWPAAQQVPLKKRLQTRTVTSGASCGQ